MVYIINFASFIFQFAIACVLAVANAAPGVIVSHGPAVVAHPVAVAHTIHAAPVAVSHSSS